MIRLQNAGLNGITDAAHHAWLDRLARMIEPSTWPQQPEPPPKPAPLYHVERDSDGSVAADEGTDLLAVTVSGKCAQEMTQRMEALKRDNKNLRYETLRLQPAPSLDHYGCAHIECSTPIAVLRKLEAFAIWTLEHVFMVLKERQT
jgi:hypothetical protein